MPAMLNMPNMPNMPMNMKPIIPNMQQNNFNEGNPALFFNAPMFPHNMPFGDDRQQPPQTIKPQPVADSGFISTWFGSKNQRRR